MTSYHYPTSKETYWQIVDTYWGNLIDIVSMFAPDMLDAAERARLEQDPKIASIFNQAWANAPDNPGIHSIPSWHVLCDLCSESYVLFDEEGNPL